MSSGMISLRPLYDFVKSDKNRNGLHRGSSERRQYGNEVIKLCQTVAPLQGFYLWGCYERNGFWRNIYLGKAGFGKVTNLRTRLREELIDERACIWCAVVSVETLKEASQRNYPSMWHRYEKHQDRFLKKAGATHIVWVAAPTLRNSYVRDIESDLIETLNPHANLSRPVPPVSLQAHTKAVIGQFRALVHRHRKAGFVLDDYGDPQ